MDHLLCMFHSSGITGSLSASTDISVKVQVKKKSSFVGIIKIFTVMADFKILTEETKDEMRSVSIRLFRT